MEGRLKLPKIGELSRKQVEELELFVERYSLDIEVGRQKTAAFVYNIYKKEEAKKKKGEEYGRKLLKDAEKLILSMKLAEGGKPPVSVAQQKVSRRTPLSGRMLEEIHAPAVGGAPGGKRMAPVSEKDLLPGEFEAIKMRARESRNKEGGDSILYLREGYYEGRPAIKIKGCPFSIVEEELPGSWKIRVSRGASGLSVSASSAILEKMDFGALKAAEGRILLLSQAYLLTLYGQGIPIEKEIELLKEKAPDAEVHISKNDLEMLRLAMGNRGIAEIEGMAYGGRILVEPVGKPGQDSHFAYTEAFGSDFMIVSVETISSYRKLPEREFKVDEALKPLSSKIIPQPAPREEVIAALKEMGFFYDPQREQTHSKYRWYHREIKNEEGEKVRDEWVNLSFHQQIDRTFLDDMLHEIPKREFERAWIKSHK